MDFLIYSHTKHTQSIQGFLIRCWLTMLVSLLLSRLCPMSRICPFYVLIMSHICPCPLYDLNLSSKSNLCPYQIPFLSSGSSFRPFFIIYVWQNLLKNWKTKTSQNLDMILYPFNIWSHCSWTNFGQSLDLYKS